MEETGKPESLKRVENLTGKTVEYHEVDILQVSDLREIFSKVSTSTDYNFIYSTVRLTKPVAYILFRYFFSSSMVFSFCLLFLRTLHRQIVTYLSRPFIVAIPHPDST